MTTIPANTCPQCGALIPEDSAHRLCPRCVFAKALAPTADGGFVSYVPPSLESVRAAFPHLEVTALIGSGGMGAVFKARQPQLDRFVALKILPAELAGQPGFSERFQREAQALARLSHPHIVTVHDFGRAGDFYFLLMEFIDGVNLRQLLQTKHLTPKEALSIVPPICEALQCAHDHGIVHRDIKPENLLIDKAGTVKIADFGIAKMVGTSHVGLLSEPDAAQERAGTLALGTPDYAAPEQRDASAVTDHRADIYSLGVVLYEMLTGERPTGKLEAPSKRVQVDIRIDEIVLRALEKSPELRFATAAEFRTQVENLNHRPAHARYGSRRRENLWLLTGGVFLALLAELLVVLSALEHKSPLGINELLILLGLSLGVAWGIHRWRNRDASPLHRPADCSPASPSGGGWMLPIAVLVLLGAGGLMMGVGVYASQNWGWGSENGAMIAGVVLPLVAGIISGWRLFREPIDGPLGPVPRAIYSVVASLGLFALIRIPGTLGFLQVVAKETLGQSTLITVTAMHNSFAQVVWALQAGATFGLYVSTQRRIQGAVTKAAARITIGCFVLLFVHSMVPWVVVAYAKLTALQKKPISSTSTAGEKKVGVSSGVRPQAQGSAPEVSPSKNQTSAGKNDEPGKAAPLITPQERHIALKYLDATLALDRIKAEHPELVGGVRRVETEGNSMVLDATSPSSEPLQKYLVTIDQPPEAILLEGMMTESLPNSPPGTGKVFSKPTITTLLGTPASFRTMAKDGLEIEFLIKANRQTKGKWDAIVVPKANATTRGEPFVLEGTVTESTRDAPAGAKKVFLLPTLSTPLGGSATFTHRLQDGRDVELSIKLAKAYVPTHSKGPVVTVPAAVKKPADNESNEIPFEGAPKLRYIAWMPKDETGWQLRTPTGEAVTAPGDIPVHDWEGWKKGLLENGNASKINDTAGWLMFFYSHPAIDKRSESSLNLFAPEGAEIQLSQHVFAPREPNPPQADGWLAVGCRVPYAAVKGQCKTSLMLTAGPWQSRKLALVGQTTNSGGGGLLLSNSGEDAKHQAFVTVNTLDDNKHPLPQWEVLGRLHDGSDMRGEGSTAVHFQGQFVHTISFGKALSSYSGFILRHRERKNFTNDGVQVPQLLVATPESGFKSTFQMRWVSDTPSADTEPMKLAGRGQSETLNIEKTVLLDQSSLQSVEVIHRTQAGGESISLQLTENGKQRFAKATREGKGRKLAIIIDGQVRAAPMIRSEISDGRVQISGNLTYEEADDLAARLRASTEDRATASYHESTKAARNEHRQKMADLLLKADRAVIFLLDFDIVPDRRLRRLAASQSGLDFVPDSKFPIYPMGTAANVLDRKTLTAQQLAPLLPHLAQAVRHDEGGHDWCHAPIHGLRLYRGNEEIFESSFCWVCSTFTLLYPDHSDLHPVHDEGLQQLMEQLMPIPAKEMERFKAKWPNLFLFRAPDEVMTQLRSDLTALMELPSSFALGRDDVEAALSDIHAGISRLPKAFEYTREELAAFRKDECPYTDADIEKAFAKLQAAAGGRTLPELIIFYRTKFAAGTLAPRQKTICYRMVAAALLEAPRAPAKP